MTNSAIADLQSLEPGGMVELVSVDGSAQGADVLTFHRYTQVGPIVWQGVSYQPWPFQVKGFDTNAAQQPVPTIEVANIDGSISALCLAFGDMVGATFVRHRTFAKYLDAVNFVGGNPTADPTQELPLDTWIIDRKAMETSVAVQWELSNPINAQGQMLPGRQIVANACAWISIGGYRGPYCGYTGGPVADANDNPTSDPTKDQCSGTVTGCKLRFGATNPLPYGSFAAAGLVQQ